MRVNPDVRSGLLAALDRVNTADQQVLRQLSSGLKIQTPSDDPAGAAALVEVQADDAATQQFLTDINALQTRMQAADSALNSVNTALRRALALAVEGANGTLSDSDRSAIANELSGIKDQLLELSNSSLQGEYLFGGTAVTTKPYLKDTNVPSGISYQGNSQSNEVEIGQNYWIGTNVPGTSIFGDGTNGVFKAMSDVISAIQNNSGVDSAVSGIHDMVSQISTARVQYGNAMNQLSSGENILNSVHIQLQQQIESISAADITQAASSLVSAETSRNALLDVIAKSNGLSLFDYLR